MTYLFSASLIWAFSFGLIKENLTTIDSNLVAFIRIFLSLLVFLPFLKIKGIEKKLRADLMITGMVQYGFMYISYIYSYQFLKGFEIALFTVFTPVYVTIIYSLIRKKFHGTFFIFSILSMLIAAIIVFKDISSIGLWKGFFLLQFSNICFAWGQVRYRELMSKYKNIRDREIFGYLYAGAFLFTMLTVLISVDPENIKIEMSQVLSLVYLGIIASGIAFFLWNKGIRKVNIGAVSIFNNLKIPFGILISLTVFREEGDLLRVVSGGLLLLILLIINENIRKRSGDKNNVQVNGARK
ncbi:MAG: EamA family transporter [Acidobacteriota bacterium]